MEQAFDTLQAACDLESSGLERKQAEAVAAADRSGQGELVTKADLAALEARRDAKLVSFENRLTLRMLGIAGLIVAAVKLLPTL